MSKNKEKRQFELLNVKSKILDTIADAKATQDETIEVISDVISVAYACMIDGAKRYEKDIENLKLYAKSVKIDFITKTIEAIENGQELVRMGEKGGKK